MNACSQCAYAVQPDSGITYVVYENGTILDECEFCSHECMFDYLEDIIEERVTIQMREEKKNLYKELCPACTHRLNGSLDAKLKAKARIEVRR